MIILTIITNSYGSITVTFSDIRYFKWIIARPRRYTFKCLLSTFRKTFVVE